MTDTHGFATPVEDLLARARAYVTHSHAKNTLDAYAADWKHFSAWCEDTSAAPCPPLLRRSSVTWSTWLTASPSRRLTGA